MKTACQICAFWKDGRCTQTWRLSVHITPNGGVVDFSTTPGMVPEHVKSRLSERFAALLERFLLPLIDAMPEWREIREFQLSSPERDQCPAFEATESVKPFLKVVK